MKRSLLVTALIFLSFFLFASTQPASSAAGNEARLDGGVLCLPGVYLQSPGDCTAAGPSTYLTQMAQMGYTFPETPLPVSPPDRALTAVDMRYGLVNKNNAPVYGSLEDAMKGNKGDAVRKITGKFDYISYTDEVVEGGRRFYMINSNEWMTANDVIRLGTVPLFQGAELTRTPQHAFGWVLSYLSPGPVESKRTPGYQTKDYTGHIFQNREIVQVYATEKVKEEDWYMVAPDEWLPHNVVARVIPNTTPPQGVTGDRWIEVNLFEQTIAVYDQRQLVFATLIASGLEPYWTRPGLFKIYSKLDYGPMSGSFEADHSDAYYLEDVPWTMYYDEARALHGAYWRANLGFPQSHGCVNLSVGDAHWIYNWANVGDWVYVWDPSGTTPTDPADYGAGGA